MTGNRNSGRFNKYSDPIRIYFQMEREDVVKLNKIAMELCRGNRSELIEQTLKKVIEKYETQ